MTNEQIRKTSINNSLFEDLDLSLYSPQEIMNGKKLYNYIVESAAIADEQNVPLDTVIDEGIFGSLLGAAAGATIGPTIMKAVCKVLGVQENGALGSLLTSKVVLAAMAGQLGYRM